MMAIAWLTILNTVPWSEVIRNAPKLADAAGKLWKTVVRKPGNETIRAEVAMAPLVIESDRHALADARIAALEDSVAQLDQQMLASSDLIRALVEQNSALIVAIDNARRQRVWLSAIAAMAVMIAVGALAAALPGGNS